MKRTLRKNWFNRFPHSKILFGCAAGLALGVTASYGQNIIFQDTFEQYALGAGPDTIEAEGPWASVSEGLRSGAMRIEQDTDNVFGYGTDNRFLRIEDGFGFGMTVPGFSTNVVTLSLDFIDQRMDPDAVDDEGDPLANAERLTTQFFAGDPAGGTRAHLFSLQNGQEIRSGAGTYPDQTRIRFDVVVNNDPNTITYDTPDGGTKDLGTGLADVWIADTIDENFAPQNYTLAAQDYNFDRGGDGDGPIENYWFQAFSNDGFSLDMDNLTLWDDATVGQVIPEPSTVALLMGAAAMGGVLFIRRRRNRS